MLVVLPASLLPTISSNAEIANQSALVLPTISGPRFARLPYAVQLPRVVHFRVSAICRNKAVHGIAAFRLKYLWVFHRRPSFSGRAKSTGRKFEIPAVEIRVFRRRSCSFPLKLKFSVKLAFRGF
jgi:hypothetical protein